MNSNFLLPLARQNLIVLALCILVVLGAALALLGPVVGCNHALDQKILAEQDRLHSLEEMAQLQQQLDQQLATLAAQSVPAAGKPEALAPEQSDRILGALQDLARHTTVEAVAITPQLEGLGEAGKAMRIEASFRGPLPSLHALVTEILLLPYVENLQSLNFAAEQDKPSLNVIFSVRTELPENRPAPPTQGEPAI